MCNAYRMQLSLQNLCLNRLPTAQHKTRDNSVQHRYFFKEKGRRKDTEVDR